MRWPQPIEGPRWPSLSNVALSLQAPKRGGESLERVSETTSQTRTAYNTFPQVPKIQLTTSSDTSPTDTRTSEEIEQDRDESLQYLERKKSNLPNMGTRVKVGKAVKNGIIQGQVGLFLGKCAVEHDLANVPRMPQSALIGVSGDELHSRDSYADIANQSIDFARRYLPQGIQGKRLVITVEDRDDTDKAASPRPQTVIPTASRPVSGAPDAYMDLGLELPEIAKNKYTTAPAALEKHIVRQRERDQANKTSKDTSSNSKIPKRYPTSLQPGPNRQDKGPTSKDQANSRPAGLTSARQVQQMPPPPIKQNQPQSWPPPENVPPVPKLPGPIPSRDPLFLNVPPAQSSTLNQLEGVSQPIGRKLSNRTSDEIRQSWEKSGKIGPRPRSPDTEKYQNLGSGMKDAERRKRSNRATAVVGGDGFTAAIDRLRFLDGVPASGASKLPQPVATPAPVLAQTPKPASEPASKSVNTAPTIPARPVANQPTQKIPRLTQSTAKPKPLDPRAPTWDGKTKQMPQNLNPRAPTWPYQPLPSQPPAPPSRSTEPAPAPAPARTPTSPQTTTPVSPRLAALSASILEPARPQPKPTLTPLNRQRLTQRKPVPTVTATATPPTQAETLNPRAKTREFKPHPSRPSLPIPNPAHTPTPAAPRQKTTKINVQAAFASQTQPGRSLVGGLSQYQYPYQYQYQHQGQHQGASQVPVTNGLGPFKAGNAAGELRR